MSSACRLFCPLGKQSCQARSRGCVHACAPAGPAGLDQLSAELAAHSQISCGCFLSDCGENRLFMEELWVLKHCCANSNSSELWRLISASSKEYGLWKWARITQGTLFFLSKKPRAGKSAMHNLYLTNMQLSLIFLLFIYLSINYLATLGFAYLWHLRQARLSGGWENPPPKVAILAKWFYVLKNFIEINSFFTLIFWYLGNPRNPLSLSPLSKKLQTKVFPHKCIFQVAFTSKMFFENNWKFILANIPSVNEKTRNIWKS